jgi:signal transduction histidine kinase
VEARQRLVPIPVPPGHRPPLVWAALLLLGGEVAAQELPHWRYFTSVDGLRESYVGSAEVGPGGTVWISHGAVDQASVFDGYSIGRIPSPGARRAIYEGVGGQLWSFFLERRPVTVAGLQTFQDGRWVRHEIPELRAAALAGEDILFGRPEASPEGQHPDFLLPTGRDRALVLLPDRLVEFDVVTRRATTVRAASETGLGRFLSLSGGREGAVLVSGEHGFLRLRGAAGGPGDIEERLFAGRGLRNLTFLHEDEQGQVLGVAEAAGPGSAGRVLVRYRAGAWEVVARAANTEASLTGWSGADGGQWLARTALNTFSLFRTRGAVQEEVKPNKYLTGPLNAVAVEPGGGFWVGTRHGLARYAPPVWRTPREAGDSEQRVSTIYEDDAGRLYVLYMHELAVLEQDRWKRHLLPGGTHTTMSRAAAMASLDDGRIALASSARTLLVFDPVHERFQQIAHPEGRTLVFVAPRRAGGVWLLSRDGDRARLEVLEKGRFRTAAEVDTPGPLAEARHAFESGAGDLWFSGNTEVGVLREGRYRAFGPADGFTGGGAFCMLEVEPGKIWFGDRNAISQFDGTWTNVRSNLDAVRMMVKSRDGSLWMATGVGVLRHSLGSWITFTAADGLPDAVATAVLEDSRGGLWVGTTRGLSRYHPEADPDPPRTLLPEAATVREVAPRGEAQFVFWGRDRWDYTPPDRLLFSHRVDEGDWSPFRPDKSAVVTGLKAGRHRFEVRAMDLNGNVDPQPARAAFNVLLPWYRELGFLAMAGLALLAVVLLGHSAVSRYISLDRLVAARTAELHAANQTLQREMAERRAIEAELEHTRRLEAVGKLAGGIAHDFNNLLTVIAGFSEVLLRQMPAGDPGRGKMEAIKTAADRAASLTRQLLAFSRKQVLQPRVLGLDAVVHEMEPILRRLIGEDIDFKVSAGPDLHRVKADPGKLEQILMNLVVNARDAMPGGGTLLIETANVDDLAPEQGHPSEMPAGPCVMLAVSDTGQGMDQATRDRIFEPFFTTKEPGQGTGLGLSTVYGIVKQTGGEIRVVSAPGRGATFKIFLPATSALPEAPVAAPAAVVETHTRASRTILLVEDEEQLRALTSEILGEEGYQVLTARHGREALKVSQAYQGHIDLLITDVVMPEMSGGALAVALGAQRPGLKVLFVSGYARNAIGDHGVIEEQVELLDKPFTAAALLDKVRAILGPA